MSSVFIFIDHILGQFEMAKTLFLHALHTLRLMIKRSSFYSHYFFVHNLKICIHYPNHTINEHYGFLWSDEYKTHTLFSMTVVSIYPKLN